MAITGLDTHEIVKDLTAAGFTEDQAEAVTRWVRKSQDLDLSIFATKADLDAGIASVRSDLSATQTDVEASIAATKTDLETSIAATRADLEARLAAIKAELQLSLAETKADILKWMVGTIGVQTVVILGAVVALSRVMAH